MDFVKIQIQKDGEKMNAIHEALAHMSKLERMNRLLYKKVEPYLGRRILEAGCGNGNFTSRLLDRELVLAVDNDELLLGQLRQRFAGCPNLKIDRYDLTDSRIRKLAGENIDTIICCNTLEHIKDDGAVLRNFNALLQRGNLVIIVPAFEFLYCSLDKAFGHYRRYTLKVLSEMARESGFTIVGSMYANFFGLAGWFVNGKILRREKISRRWFGLFNFLTPAFELFERLTGPPVGLSIILICKKKD